MTQSVYNMDTLIGQQKQCGCIHYFARNRLGKYMIIVDIGYCLKHELQALLERNKDKKNDNSSAL